MNKVTFRCKRSGNTVSFTNENDIAGMRKHEGYDEVIDNVETAKAIETEPQKEAEKTVLTLRRGRPPKNPMTLE